MDTRIGPGKEGMGYFNLFEKGCLNGHLVKDSVSHIAFLKLPFYASYLLPGSLLRKRW